MPRVNGGNDEVGGKALSVGQDWQLRLGHPGLTMMNVMPSKRLVPKLTGSESAEIAKSLLSLQDG